ncbi:MAG: DUF302 domain-containing protein [Gammaproteobacteria bacterium]|nr:DUF302 domain-containing protein [Gammaproteobacteria bacterium]
MNTLKNVLAIIGLLAVMLFGLGFYQVWSATRDFDPDAFKIYKEFVSNLLETGDLADAFVWAVPVADGVEVEDVKESMKSLAVERNFLFVNESPFYKQAQAVTGEEFRHVSFMQFCDVRVGIEMLEHNNAYSAFMPCVISVVEDQDGKLWLYAMNMDFLIHGARELPPELKSKALRVRRVMREIMEGAATGEF